MLDDVLMALSDPTRRAVLAMSGIELIPEVRLVGTFQPSLFEDLSPYHFLPVLLARST